MTRQEWEQEYRVARAMLNMVHLSDIKDEVVWKEAWHRFWYGCVLQFQSEIYRTVIDRHAQRDRYWATDWGIDSRNGMKCNVEHLRNSYPHRGRSV